MKQYLLIDIGGTFIKYSLADEQARKISGGKVPTPLTNMDDLLAAGCKILTIGQYLQPSHRHYPVTEHVTPEQFAAYKKIGLEKGFEQVESAPLVRSSYHAEKHVSKF